MKRSSVRPSVCPINRPQQRRGFVVERLAGERSIDNAGHPAATAPQHGTQQQMRTVSR